MAPVTGVFLDDELIESMSSEADDAVRTHVDDRGGMTFAAPPT